MNYINHKAGEYQEWRDKSLWFFLNKGNFKLFIINLNEFPSLTGTTLTAVFGLLKIVPAIRPIENPMI